MSYIRRITVMLAGLAGAALAFSQAAPLLSPCHHHPTWAEPKSSPAAIALIAAGAALLTAALAVTADRMRAARRRVTRHAT